MDMREVTNMMRSGALPAYRMGVHREPGTGRRGPGYQIRTNDAVDAGLLESEWWVEEDKTPDHFDEPPWKSGTVDRAAYILGVQASTLRAMIAAGLLSARSTDAELEAFIETRRVDPSSVKPYSRRRDELQERQRNRFRKAASRKPRRQPD
jgi:hypothetical protein